MWTVPVQEAVRHAQVHKDRLQVAVDYMRSTYAPATTTVVDQEQLSSISAVDQPCIQSSTATTQSSPSLGPTPPTVVTSLGPLGVTGASCAAADSGSLLVDVVFDSERMLNCTVENGQTLIHGATGRGYGLAAVPITAGCYQWKVSDNSWVISMYGE